MGDSAGEAITRAVLHEAFPGKKFIKTRQPLWLQGCELDCYNEELRLAFEYQGGQHYFYVPHFHHGNINVFHDQVRRDQLKRERADDEWITLIEIPYTVPLIQIREHVRAILLELAYDIAPIQNKDDQKFVAEAVALGQTADYGGARRKSDEENHELVESAGYKLLGNRTIRIGAKDKSTIYLKVECPAGHVYEVSRCNFAPVVDGKPRKGCIRCARARTNQERAIKEREERARGFGIEPIIERNPPFADRHTKLHWRCRAAGHEFEISWNSLIIRDKKCQLC